MKKVKIGISIGDINGVGPEVIIKTLSDERILNFCTPIIYGSSKVISYYKNIVDPSFKFTNCNDASKAKNDAVSIINCWNDDVSIKMGEATEESGKCAHIALDKACSDLIDHKIDALVTAPINKKAMQMTNFGYPGHTEFLAAKLNSADNLMMLVSENIRVALVTNHLPVSDISKKISKKLLKSKLIMLHNSLKDDFGIEKPKIAMLGLNPHAGDHGAIGDQEESILKPIILEAKKAGKLVMGPFPADGFFGSNMNRNYDAILGMYHDQGLIPFKIMSFGAGVNYTAGMDYIRTSVDHGTAYDIVGQNKANPQSMRLAIYEAIDIYRNRANNQTGKTTTESKEAVKS